MPVAIKNEITRVSHEAITDANRDALLVGTIIAFFGLVASLWLANRQELEIGQSAAHHAGGDAAAEA